MTRRRVAIISSFFRLGQWRGIMRYGQQAGWICQRIERDTLARLNSWNPDGVLFQVDEFDTPVLDFITRCQRPKVGLRALPESAGDVPLVLPDLTDFGRRIASHFVARNYRRLCYLGPSSDDTANAGATHFAGMQEVADAHGIHLEGFFPDLAATWKALGLIHRRRSATDWERFWEMGPAIIHRITRDSEPVALFSAFAEPAMEFMEMVDERQLAIPSQIGLAAQTEDALNGLVTKVPLTCLVPDYEHQGYAAAQLLDRMLAGEPVAPNHRSFLRDCELVLRKSSNQIVTSDSTVGEMLEHLRQHVLDPRYSPEVLASAFGCSLRLVQLRFRKALQRGVAEIIREHRTHHATDLIRRTNLTLQEIVSTSGFTCHHQLERAIRSCHGLSPSALRKQQGSPAEPSTAD
ncbi:MAG: substrate-binding domain-containing protein [Akkermansiaceae bacterium]|nr:substrate-binding domain-containing protein [Akkermansiaceae bacterium]MCF7730627.1 substrate-binding domain-containing protein [Akkermansiaceae bacterium]